MKFYELIHANNWLSIEMTLLDLYPDQFNMLEEYRNVFERLKNLEPEESKWRIILSEEEEDPDDDGEITTYIDVSGQDGTKDENGTIISYALEFTEWKEWLGMDIDTQTFENFTELEIIAHCLYEMTFVGFDEDEIQGELRSFDKTVEEYKNLTEEEKQQRTISLEDLLKLLDENDESSEIE